MRFACFSTESANAGLNKFILRLKTDCMHGISNFLDDVLKLFELFEIIYEDF